MRIIGVALVLLLAIVAGSFIIPPAVADIVVLIVMLIGGFIGLIGIIGVFRGFFNVSDGKVAIITWKSILTYPFFGSTRKGHIHARKWANGTWFVHFDPGKSFCWGMGLFGKITEIDAIVIPPEYVGIVIANDGRPLPDGKVASEKNFEPEIYFYGQRFIEEGGERGTQTSILFKTGTYGLNARIIPNGDGKDEGDAKKSGESEIKTLFSIELRKLVKIQPRELTDKERSDFAGENMTEWPRIGLVTMNVGQPFHAERENKVIAPRAESEDKSVTHNNFQNLRNFLHLMNGYEGMQEDVVEANVLAINELAVHIDVVDMPFVREGSVAVQISNIGPQASYDDFIDDPVGWDDGVTEEDIVTESGETKKVPRKIHVLKPKFGTTREPAKRGILSVTLDPGFQNTNTIGRQLIMVDVTPQGITGDSQEESIDLITKNKYRPRVKYALGFRILRENAPKMIALNRSSEEFVEDSIRPRIAGLLLNTVREYDIDEFLDKREEAKEKIEAKLREIITKRFGTFLYFRISEIDTSTDPQLKEYMEIETAKINAKRRIGLIQAQTKVEEERINLESNRAKADNQEILVISELRKLAAENFDSKTINIRDEAIAKALKGLVGEDWRLKVAHMLNVDRSAILAIMEGLTSIFGPKKTA